MYSQVEAGLAIRECPNDTGTPADLSHDPLQWIVGSNLLPMNVWEGVIGQRLLHAPLDKIGRGVHPGSAQIVDDRPCLSVGRITAFLRMDGFEHVAHLADLCRWHMAEDVSIKMHHAALPLGFRQVLRGTLHQAAAGIRDDQLHALEATIDQLRRNADQPDLSSLAPSQRIPPPRTALPVEVFR